MNFKLINIQVRQYFQESQIYFSLSLAAGYTKNIRKCKKKLPKVTQKPAHSIPEQIFKKQKQN